MLEYIVKHDIYKVNEKKNAKKYKKCYKIKSPVKRQINDYIITEKDGNSKTYMQSIRADDRVLQREILLYKKEVQKTTLKKQSIRS